MKGNLSIIRQVLQRRFSTLRSSSALPSTLPNSPQSLISPTNSIPSQIHRMSLFKSSNTYLPTQRSFCSTAGGAKGVVIVKTEEEFTNAMNKAKDGNLPSIFYFTAAWCGPCRFIAPVIDELSKQYPDVTTYKIDIDEGGLAKILSKLNIAAVPTLQLFKEGLKKDEIVGADVTKLKNLMEQHYK